MGCSYQKTSIHVILDQIQDLLAWEDSYYGAVIRNTHAGQRVYVAVIRNTDAGQSAKGDRVCGYYLANRPLGRLPAAQTLARRIIQSRQDTLA